VEVANWGRSPLLDEAKLHLAARNRSVRLGARLRHVIGAVEGHFIAEHRLRGRDGVGGETEAMPAAAAEVSVRQLATAEDERIVVWRMAREALRAVLCADEGVGPERLAAVVQQQLRACPQMLARQRVDGGDLRGHDELAVLVLRQCVLPSSHLHRLQLAVGCARTAPHAVSETKTTAAKLLASRTELTLETAVHSVVDDGACSGGVSDEDHFVSLRRARVGVRQRWQLERGRAMILVSELLVHSLVHEEAGVVQQRHVTIAGDQILHKCDAAQSRAAVQLGRDDLRGDAELVRRLRPRQIW
jgi:hypothetical protein